MEYFTLKLTYHIGKVGNFQKRGTCSTAADMGEQDRVDLPAEML